MSESYLDFLQNLRASSPLPNINLKYEEAFKEIFNILQPFQVEKRNDRSDIELLEQNFKVLYRKLLDPRTKKDAFEMVDRLEEQQNSIGKTAFFELYNFKIIRKYGLRIIVFKSVFEPEEWTDNFKNGVGKYDLKGKVVCELGKTRLNCCSSSNPSKDAVVELTAKHFGATKVVGLDINSHAVLNSQLNALLNGVENVQFVVSDLLRLNLFTRFHYIIGCIPQIFKKDGIQQNSLVELESSSHFCVAQGNVWDECGLGLNAQALMDSIRFLRNDGKMVLNLAGRLGPEFLSTMACMLGFSFTVKHQKIFQQATTGVQGTCPDLSPFCEFETMNPEYSCQFFIGEVGETEKRINAHMAQDVIFKNWKLNNEANSFLKNAKRFLTDETVKKHVDELCVITSIKTKIEGVQDLLVSASASGKNLATKARSNLKSAIQQLKKQTPVSHYVSVYEFTPLCPRIQTKLFDFFGHGATYHFSSEEKVKEIIPFVEKLIDHIKLNPYFDYGDIRGSPLLRSGLAGFFNVGLGANNMFITPSLKTSLINLFTVYPPQTVLTNAPKLVPSLVISDGVNVHTVSDMKELSGGGERKHDEMVLVKVVNANEMKMIIKRAEAANSTRFFVVIDKVDTSSEDASLLVMKEFGDVQFPINLTLFYDLSGHDLQLNVIISRSVQFLKNLELIGELTYSRIPFCSEFYFEWKYEKYIKKGPEEESTPKHSPVDEKIEIFPTIPERVSKVFQSDTMESCRVVKETTVEADYGSNEMKSPKDMRRIIVASLLFESFNPPPTKKLYDVMKKYLLAKFDFPAKRFVFGMGTAAIMEGIIRYLAQDDKSRKFVVPRGVYAEFVNTSELRGLEVITVDTLEKDGFKFTPSQIENVLKVHPNACFFINAPYVNPTSQSYSTSELLEIKKAVDAQNAFNRGKAKIILDTIFTFLDVEDEYFLDLSNLNKGDNVIIMEGISKYSAAGGIRFGFACTGESEQEIKMIEFVKMHVEKPPDHVLFAMGEFYEKLCLTKSNVWMDLSRQQMKLKKRAQELISIISRGMDVLPPKGGLFLCARPNEKILGTEVNGLKITEENFAQVLFDTVDVRINSCQWTSLTRGYTRIVISLQEKQFQELKKRMQRFFDLVLDD